MVRNDICWLCIDTGAYRLVSRNYVWIIFERDYCPMVHVGKYEVEKEYSVKILKSWQRSTFTARDNISHKEIK